MKPANLLRITACLALVAALWLTHKTGDAAEFEITADEPILLRSDFTHQLEGRAGPESAGSTIVNGLSQTAVAALSAANISTDDYPHIALYGGPNSSGWPMVGTLDNSRPPAGAPLNEDVMNAYARFPHLILPAMPLSDERPDILTSLRQRNPEVVIHAYVMGHTTWCPRDANGNIGYSVNTYYRDYYLAVTDGDPSCDSTSNRFLWMQDGILASEQPHNLGINVNLAHRVQNPDTTYTYDVAEALAETMYEYGRADRNWNGIFIDVYCPGIMWMESSGHLFDYARSGYGNDNADPANRSAFDAGWQAGFLRLSERLRELAVADGHPNYPISGNCGQAPATLHPILNGWMREGFPFQNSYAGSADFYSNLLAWPWGLLHQDRNFRSPQFNYIFTAANWSGGMTNEPDDEQYNSFNQRKMRFGLASVSLGNGQHAFHHSSGNPANGYWFNWWYDEYAVNTSVPQSDPNWGRSTIGATNTGWLGSALGPAYAHLANSYATQPDLLTTNQGFENFANGAFTNWTQFINPGTTNSVVQDTQTFVEGSASAKITITHPGSNPMISLVNGSFPVTAGVQYSITFWAKASAPLPVQVSFWSGSSGAVQSIPVDTTWRQYQAVVRSLTSTGSTGVAIGLGHQAGTYWIDNIHVQSGATAVWRRDFENGIVLVNPGAIAQTIALERPYRKILGTVNPQLNDGSRVSSLTLAGTNTGGGIGDGIFLLTLDETPPSSIDDLTAGSP